MKIANIELPDRAVMLAPMEDVTDVGFRLQCKQFGADMVYSEFVSADALIRSIDKTMQKLKVLDEERPVVIQIYGKEVGAMVEAARMADKAAEICGGYGCDVVDINFGCPVKRVAGKGAGAGLLQNIPLMLEITRAVVDAVKIPVTCKTRLGWDCEHKIIVELAEQLQDQGIAALAIHGRTRSQMYNGEADWTLIYAGNEGQTSSHSYIYSTVVTDLDRTYEAFGEAISFNLEYLSAVGATSESTYDTVMTIRWIMIAFVAVAVVFFVGNSALISYKERYRETGNLLSNGATAKQIGLMMFCEILIMSLISIPTGIFIGWSIIRETIDKMSPLFSKMAYINLF